MSNAYDLFIENRAGEKAWVETVIGLHNLKKRLRNLSSISPGTYVIYDPTQATFIEPFKKSSNSRT